MSPSHAMASSVAGSAGQTADGTESLPNDEEFQEARDGASQQPEGSVERDFPDAVPLDPPYFDSQQETRSVMFGLSAEVAQYLDQVLARIPLKAIPLDHQGLCLELRLERLLRYSSVSWWTVGWRTGTLEG